MANNRGNILATKNYVGLQLKDLVLIQKPYPLFDGAKLTIYLQKMGKEGPFLKEKIAIILEKKIDEFYNYIKKRDLLGFLQHFKNNISVDTGTPKEIMDFLDNYLQPFSQNEIRENVIPYIKTTKQKLIINTAPSPASRVGSSTLPSSTTARILTLTGNVQTTTRPQDRDNSQEVLASVRKAYDEYIFYKEQSPNSSEKEMILKEAFLNITQIAINSGLEGYMPLEVIEVYINALPIISSNPTEPRLNMENEITNYNRPM